MKKFCKLWIAVISMFITVVFCMPIFSAPAFAYTEYDYEEVGFNFLKTQYNIKNIKYDTIYKQDSFNLYGIDDCIVAKSMAVNRDGVLDYVALDFIVDRIDEFGFEQERFVKRLTIDYFYLRIVDGWDSSNQSRFIDYNGYYSVISGIDFGIL